MQSDAAPVSRLKVHCTRLDGSTNAALDPHTDVHPRNGHRLIVSWAGCQCTAADVAGLGATKSRVSACGGIASSAADLETEGRSRDFTRGFRANLSLLEQSAAALG